jgi:hypothetical protein
MVVHELERFVDSRIPCRGSLLEDAQRLTGSMGRAPLPGRREIDCRIVSFRT